MNTASIEENKKKSEEEKQKQLTMDATSSTNSDSKQTHAATPDTAETQAAGLGKSSLTQEVHLELDVGSALRDLCDESHHASDVFTLVRSPTKVDVRCDV